MSIAENIKKLREQHNMTQLAFGEIAGVSDKAVSTWENGTAEPRLGSIEKIAGYFNIAKCSLLDDELPFATLPIMGTICAGDGVYCQDDYQGRFVIDTHVNADFCLRVKGDSMVGADIYDGDIAFIKKDDYYQDGDIYAIERLEYGEASLKRLYINGDFVMLIPCNSDYSPISTTSDRIRIIGRCAGVYHTR